MANLTFKCFDKENQYITLNMNKIDFLEIEEENDDYTVFILKYRKKAALITKRFILKLKKNEISKKLAKFSLYRIEKYYVNTKTFKYIEEQYDLHNIKLIFYFDNTFLEFETNKARWESWKGVRI